LCVKLVLNPVVEEENTIRQVRDHLFQCWRRLRFLEGEEDTLLVYIAGLYTVHPHVVNESRLGGGELLGVSDHGRKNHFVTSENNDSICFNFLNGFNEIS
jgi:hypothetical protein